MKNTTDIQDTSIIRLGLTGEDHQTEAKSARGGLPSSVWETYSAFANTNGGRIFLGVTEGKDGTLRLTGVDDAAALRKAFWDTINNRQKVSRNILSDSDFTELSLDNGKTAFIINVPRARLELRPIYINNSINEGTYKRNYEGDYRCTIDEIQAMIRDAGRQSYDTKVLTSFSLSDLLDSTITTYRRLHEAYRPGHPWLRLKNEEYLVKIGAAALSDEDDKVHPTIAGMLMFSEEYLITRVMPSYFLDYRECRDPRVRWTDRMQSESGDWSGNVFDFYTTVKDKLTLGLRVPFKLDGMVRVDNTSLHDAVREAFINTLSNADYDGCGGVVIRKYPDCVIFENPGSIRVGKAQMLQGGMSDARNKTIMKMFNILGFGEKAGSGIPLIFDAAREFGCREPEIKENLDFCRTTLTIWTNDEGDNENKTAENMSLPDSHENLRESGENLRESGENLRESSENLRESGKNLRESGKNLRESGKNLRESGDKRQEYKDIYKKLDGYLKGKKESTKNSFIFLYNSVKESGSSTTALAEATNNSKRWVQLLLKDMVAIGLVKEIGASKNKRYYSTVPKLEVGSNNDIEKSKENN